MIEIVSSLPNALTNKETCVLMRDMHVGSKFARETLIIQNLRLVAYIVTKRFFNTPFDRDELFSVGTIGLMKAVDTYYDEDVAFSSYAYKCITNEILLYMRNNSKHMNTSSIYDEKYYDDESETKLLDILVSDIDIERDYIKEELYANIRRIIGNLSAEDRLLVELYYGFLDGNIYNQKDIAAIMHRSQAEISRRHKKIVMRLRTILENYDLIDKKTPKKRVFKDKTKK